MNNSKNIVVAPSLALVPSLLVKKFSTTQRYLFTLLMILAGIAALGALAQLRVHLPWTPVPITGQTFGVAMVALLFGARMASAVVGGYLALGFMGLPLFALTPASGFLIGPTFGYLLGMFVSSIVVGSLADRGWAKSFKTAFFAAAIGSVCVFSFGLLVLSYFVPAKALLAAGFVPFLPGDLIKNTLAAWIASRAKLSK